MDKICIKSLSPEKLGAEMAAMGERPFRVTQIFRWLYKEDAASFDDMTDISKILRARLKERFTLLRFTPSDVLKSDDGTQKLVFTLDDGNRIESVLIPELSRMTLCVSSQIGCRWGCKFCRTGTMSLVRNLTPAEIVEQYNAAQRAAGERRISNIVFMGMGEPLDNLENVVEAIKIFYADHGHNLSSRKVTVSTVGLVPQLDELGKQLDVSLAVSLHGPDDETRGRLVPAGRKWPLKELLDACRRFPMTHRRRVTFEYSLVAGVNDSDEHARKLARLAPDLRPKINLIAVNCFDSSDYQSPTEERVRRFQQILIDNHITAVLRKSRGRDILAACGQLAARPFADEDDD